MKGSVKVYPNPSSNAITVSLAELPYGASWKLLLLNTMGQVIIDKNYNRNTTTVSLPVGNYPAGVYTLQIADGTYTQVKKLLINHN